MQKPGTSHLKPHWGEGRRKNEECRKEEEDERGIG
jgi:hypothetical protein